MSSDDAYGAFLDKANQDTGASTATTKSSAAQLKTTDTEVPAALQSIEQYYTSEADEPFEPVSLKWKGQNMPSESRLSTLSYCCQVPSSNTKPHPRSAPLLSTTYNYR